MLTLLTGSSHVQEEWRGEVVEVSWSPRAFLLKNFLSDKECQHFINKVSLQMREPLRLAAAMMRERSRHLEESGGMLYLPCTAG